MKKSDVAFIIILFLAVCLVAFPYKNEGRDSEHRVLNLCGEEEKVIGWGFGADPLDKDVNEFQKVLSSKSGVDVYEFAVEKGYDWVTMDVSCLTLNFLSEPNFVRLLNEMYNFIPLDLNYNNDNFWLFEVIS